MRAGFCRLFECPLAQSRRGAPSGPSVYLLPETWGATFALTVPPWVFDVNTVTKSMHRHVCQRDLGMYSLSPCGRRACEQTAASPSGSSHGPQTHAPVSAKSEPHYGSCSPEALYLGTLRNWGWAHKACQPFRNSKTVRL